MTLNEYTVSGLIDTHARPYVFTVENKSTKGAVLVFGAEHSFDPDCRGPLHSPRWAESIPPPAAVLGDSVMKQ